MSEWIEFWAKTNKGLVRSVNEDACIFQKNDREHAYLVLLADGMGGHKKGELASHIAANFVAKRIKRDFSKIRTERDLRRSLVDAFLRANIHVYSVAQSREETKGMGTTLTAIYFSPGSMNIAHLGDCRIYLLRDRKFYLLTKDHNYYNLLLSQGVSPQEAKADPRANQLTKALGDRHLMEPDLLCSKLKKGDRILFCTDGLYSELGDRDLAFLLEQAESPQDALNKLFSAVLQTSAKDNVTAVVGFVLQDEEEFIESLDSQSDINEDDGAYYGQS